MTGSRIVGEGDRDSEELHRRAKSGHQLSPMSALIIAAKPWETPKAGRIKTL